MPPVIWFFLTIIHFHDHQRLDKWFVYLDYSKRVSCLDAREAPSYGNYRCWMPVEKGVMFEVLCGSEVTIWDEVTNWEVNCESQFLPA